MSACIGWFQKISIPYHGGHEYFNPPLAPRDSKMLIPPCPPNSKIANSPSLPDLFNSSCLDGSCILHARLSMFKHLNLSGTSITDQILSKILKVSSELLELHLAEKVHKREVFTWDNCLEETAVYHSSPRRCLWIWWEWRTSNSKELSVPEDIGLPRRLPF